MRRFILAIFLITASSCAMEYDKSQTALIVPSRPFSTNFFKALTQHDARAIAPQHVQHRRHQLSMHLPHPEFTIGTPALIYCLVNFGLRELDIATVPLLFTSKTFLDLNHFWAIALPSSLLIHKQRVLSLFNNHDQYILQSFASSALETRASVWFSERLFRQRYSMKKLVILHELYHIVQTDPDTHIVRTVNPTAYPLGIEQEADAQALLHCHCHDCAQEFITTITKNYRPGYLPYAQARAIGAHIPKTQLCDYHRLLNNRTRTDSCYSPAILRSMAIDIEERIATEELAP